MNKQQKLKAMTRLWCKWNRRELSEGDFALAVEKLYRKEIHVTWNDPLEKLLYNR